MLKSHHVCIFYLFLIFLLFSKDVLYSGGTYISLSIISLTSIVSVIYFIKSLTSGSINKNYFYWVWCFFLLLNTLMIVLAFLGIFGVFNEFGLDNIIAIFLVLISFFPIYYFTQRKVPIEKYLSLFLLFMIPISVIEFYNFRSSILVLQNTGNGNLVNNFAYSFVYLFPYIFFIKRKSLSITIFLIIVFMTVQGAKRGAILAILAGALVYFYNYIISTKGRYINRFLSYSLSFLIMSISAVFIYYTIFNNEFLVSRLENVDGGSGRDIIYSNLLNAWLNSESILNIIFGYGYSATLELSGMGLFAHNDWLELLINYGLVGVVTYALLFILILLFLFSSKNDKNSKIVLASILLIWLITSMVSMNFSNIQSVLQSVLLAYIFSSKAVSKKIIPEFTDENTFNR